VTPDVDAIAAAVVQSRLVAALSPGIETYLPGRRVAGVRIGADEVEVHVVARWGNALSDLAADVRRAVSAAAGDRRVAVHIDDIELPSPSETTMIHDVRRETNLIYKENAQ
jgi:hypothetical protein